MSKYYELSATRFPLVVGMIIDADADRVIANRMNNALRADLNALADRSIQAWNFGINHESASLYVIRRGLLSIERFGGNPLTKRRRGIFGPRNVQAAGLLKDKSDVTARVELDTGIVFVKFIAKLQDAREAVSLEAFDAAGIIENTLRLTAADYKSRVAASYAGLSAEEKDTRIATEYERYVMQLLASRRLVVPGVHLSLRQVRHYRPKSSGPPLPPMLRLPGNNMHSQRRVISAPPTASRSALAGAVWTASDQGWIVVDALLAVLGEASPEGEVSLNSAELGSWWQTFKFWQKLDTRPLDMSQLNLRLQAAASSDSYGLRDETDNAVKLIAALKNEKRACVVVGQIVILKTEDTLVVHQVDSVTAELIVKTRQLMQSPEAVMRFLGGEDMFKIDLLTPQSNIATTERPAPTDDPSSEEDLRGYL